MTRQELIDQYAVVLKAHIEAHPEMYPYRATMAAAVAGKMIEAVSKGSFTLERDTALAKLCKDLGIKPTSKDLQAWYKENIK